MEKPRAFRVDSDGTARLETTTEAQDADIERQIQDRVSKIEETERLTGKPSFQRILAGTKMTLYEYVRDIEMPKKRA